jgi:hypothetical protein
VIPVYQTMTVANDGEGNCFNACIASILELPLRDVAQIHPKFDGDYWGAWEDWFAERDLFLTHRGLRNGPPKGFSIANGRSSRTYPDGHKQAGERIHHAVVVFNGEIVHDPFPIKGEFGEVNSYFTIDPITDEQRTYLDSRRKEAA